MGVVRRCFDCSVLLVAVFAVLIGYLSTFELPLAPVFKYMHVVMGIIQGKPQTEQVPADFAALPRPDGELFLPMPSGAKMPANGIGMCCRPTAYDDDSVRRTILWYLLLGGRHIDTADIYTNHRAIGEGIRDAIARGIPRSEIFVTSKVFPASFGFDSSTKVVRRMLEELGLDYVDLVLLHAPRNFHPRLWLSKEYGWDDEFKNHDCQTQSRCRTETWRALSKMIDEGLVKDAGVSNFNIGHMQEIQALKLARIAANQMQYHPWVGTKQQQVVDFCHQHKIAVTAYFSMGGFMNTAETLDLDIVDSVAKAHGRSAGQVLLRWSLDKNISVIPGTGNPKHMRQNLDLYSFKLTTSEMEKLNALSAHPLAEKFFDLNDIM